jgi:hypothetical protein
MSFVADAVKSVGNAIGGAVKAVGEAVSGIAKTVGGIAGAVGDFITKSPIGNFLQCIPGIGSVVSMIGQGANLVAGVAGQVANVADFAAQLGGQISQVANDASGLLSGTSLGFLGSAIQSFTGMDGLVGLSQGLSSLFSNEAQNTPEQQNVADLGVWNVAQMLAKRQAELMMME